LASSPLSLPWGIISKPDAVVEQLLVIKTAKALLLVLSSGAFLSLCKLKLLPALGIVTVLALLSQQPAQRDLELHYLLVPSLTALLIVTAAISDQAPLSGLRRFNLNVTWARAEHLLCASILSTTALVWIFFSPLPPSLAADYSRFTISKHDRIARHVLKNVPAEVAVSAQSPFVPHLAARQDVYQFPRVLDAQYVVVDAYGDIPKADLEGGYAECLSALPRLGFDVVESVDGVTLWRKSRPAESVPDVPIHCSGQRP
jgi:hypothetical protein